MSRCVEVRRARPWLGTFVEITARGVAPMEGVEAAFAVIEKVHRLMSFHDAASDVSRLNVADPGEKIALHPWTHWVLRIANRLSEASGGVFDITIAPELAARGFLPATENASGSWRDLRLDANGTGMKTQAVVIDLGGIAKGFAVDQAVRKLKRHRGIASGLVNAGGDLRAFGDHVWPVGIRHAAQPGERAATVHLRNAALATSGGYFRNVAERGRQITAMVDGITRQPLSATGSVSVIAPTAVVADALTKVMSLAPKRSRSLLSRYRATAFSQNGREN